MPKRGCGRQTRPTLLVRSRHGPPLRRQALRYIARLGPDAIRFAPLLRGAVEQDERLRYSGGWRGITEDEEAHFLANEALAAIAP